VLGCLRSLRLLKTPVDRQGSSKGVSTFERLRERSLELTKKGVQRRNLLRPHEALP
jgi:hypothetical protein